MFILNVVQPFFRAIGIVIWKYRHLRNPQEEKGEKRKNEEKQKLSKILGAAAGSEPDLLDDAEYGICG